MKKVVITGAAGNMGRKLSEHLAGLGGYDLRLLDVTGGDKIIGADLTRYEDAWVEHFTDADAVVHLAADRSPSAPWSRIVPLNVDLLINVYEAARSRGSRRIIFASSNWVLGGYRFRSERLTPDTGPEPVNPYGAAKLFGERLGKSLSEHSGMSVINLRIGYNQWLRDNRPGPAMELGAWGQMLWLSDRDYLQVVTRAIEVEDVRYATLNVTSNIVGGRWDISETKRVLGYEPADTHRVDMPFLRRMTDALARLRDRGGPALRRLFRDDW
jgi:NAD+ dependent glucose-6-phosphate dehydrogenase